MGAPCFRIIRSRVPRRQNDIRKAFLSQAAGITQQGNVTLGYVPTLTINRPSILVIV
jgi:hypothetical protein